MRTMEQMPALWECQMYKGGEKEVTHKTPRERPNVTVSFSLRFMLRPMMMCHGRSARMKSMAADQAVALSVRGYR